ncbi:hypothetical protein [Streptomyces sp. SM12]|uniref:hypothetical protein n=1 Tax=Streptomyces sp. SM12 TaxID=1071602 RepID=UPI000CD5C7D3|nr:hypothetical protein [Streptomyces sp. SM12]
MPGTTIPAGITPADDNKAAGLFGISRRTWCGRAPWEKNPHIQQLRPAGHRRSRIFSLEQLVAVRAAQLFADAVGREPDYSGVPAAPDGPASPDDLLDLEAAWYAIPSEQRVTPATWRAYRSGDKTQLPAPDVVCGGTALWYRETILRWHASRPGPGGGSGRPRGSVNRGPRPVLAGNAEQIVQLLRAREGTTVTAGQVADKLRLSPSVAARLLRQARLTVLAALLQTEKGATAERAGEVACIGGTRHVYRLLQQAAT